MSRKEKEEQLKQYIPEGAPASVSAPIPREKLPENLQKLVNDEGFFDDLRDGKYAYLEY